MHTLAQARLQQLMSRNQLSGKSQVAVTTIIAIERGSKPHLSTIKKLSEALGVEPTSIDWPGLPFQEGKR